MAKVAARTVWSHPTQTIPPRLTEKWANLVHRGKSYFENQEFRLITLREEINVKELIAELKIANWWSKILWIAELKIANRPSRLEIAELKIAKLWVGLEK